MDRANELRWRWRMLVLDILLAVASKLVPGPRWTEFDERARALRRDLEAE